MRRGPYRQAIPIWEVREREQRRVRYQQLRVRAAVLGGALTVVAVAVIVVVSLIGAFGLVNAGGTPSATPPLLAQGPGGATHPADLAANRLRESRRRRFGRCSAMGSATLCRWWGTPWWENEAQDRLESLGVA